MKYLFFLLCCLAVIVGGCKKPDMVVLPPPGTVAVSTINNYLNNNFDFSLFAAALAKSGLADSLGRQDVISTVFAITNQGFAGMGIYEAVDFNRWTTDSLQQLIRTHILPGRVLYDDIPRSLDTRFKNVNGDDLFISAYTVSDGLTYNYLTVNGIHVIPNSSLNTQLGTASTYGVSLLNGMVYPVSTAIKASRLDIQSYLASRGDMSIFIAGMKKFGLWERLKVESPITVLAPPDTVFLRYGITADSIGKMSETRYKSVFMSCYIITLNRIFTSDVFTFLNRENVPGIPPTFPPLLTLPTTDSSLVLCMLGNYGQFYFGNFVFDVSKPEGMPDEYGGTYWAYRILGSEGASYPEYGNETTGYSVPYAGESKRARKSPRGAYINYSLSNGVVHLLSGLLLMPEDVQR